MAHEVGHQLLPTGDHYPTGLMRANFRWKDLRRAEWGKLVFTREQAHDLRAGVLARMEQEKADRISAPSS